MIYTKQIGQLSNGGAMYREIIKDLKKWKESEFVRKKEFLLMIIMGIELVYNK